MSGSWPKDRCSKVDERGVGRAEVVGSTGVGDQVFSGMPSIEMTVEWSNADEGLDEGDGRTMKDFVTVMKSENNQTGQCSGRWCDGDE